MWKIERLVDGDSVVLKLSGRIEQEELRELRKVFASEAEAQNIVLDLEEVKLAGQAAVTFLASCNQLGVTLRNCPAYIREWIAAVDAHDR